MKKNRPSGGKPVSLRVLLYTFAFVAVIGARETLTDGTGPVSRQLGVIFNETLKAGSKLGLGFALMSQDVNDKTSLRGRASLMLGKAAHNAFVSASKVDIYGH